MVMAGQKQKKTAELLQQSSGPLRFGNTERSVSSLTEGPPKRKKFFSESEETGGITLKTSSYKSYDDLPLFLNARTVAQVLGVSISTAYELMHKQSFPVLRVGSRMVVGREQFLRWTEERSGGAQ